MNCQFHKMIGAVLRAAPMLLILGVAISFVSSGVTDDQSKKTPPRKSGSTQVMSRAEGPAAVVRSPQEDVLAIGSWFGALSLVDVTTGAVLGELEQGLSPEEATVSAEVWLPRMIFSPDGHTLAVNRANSGVDLWDLSTMRKKAHVGSSFPPHMAFSSDSHLFVATGVTVWSLYDAGTGQMRVTTSEEERISAISFSKDNSYLMVTLGTPETNNVRLYRVYDGALAVTIACRGAQFVGTGGQSLVVDNLDDSVTFYDLARRKERVRIKLGRQQ